MDSLLQKRVYYFRDLLSEYPGCRNPQIQIRTLSGIDIACIINGAVHFYTTPGIENCLEAFITCDDCYQSAPLRIVKCFCDDKGECPNCQFCDPNGMCQPRCPDSACVNDVCYECSDDHPCSDDKVCNNGKCECPPGYKKDILGICRECITDGDCDQCEECFGFVCTTKKCPGGYINPKTCGCVECFDNTHCTEPNTCCDPASGTCKCCPGYYKDPITNLCTKIPDCVAGDCPACFECRDKQCVPQSCPPGHVHVGSNCCMKVCDCANPSCPPGYSCWPVPGQNICVCRSCNVPCDNGRCPEWCNCDNGNCSPKKRKCFGYCDENTPCPNGCGCNLDTNECQDCTGNDCSNNDCEKLVGCRCNDNFSTGTSNNSTSSCEPDPCHKPCANGTDCPDECGCNDETNRCEPCDRPCDNNLDCEHGCYCHQGTKRCRKNPCAKGCENGKDCGPGCGCWEDKGCYPCDSFDCINCAQVNGCNCSDGVNCGEKKTDCTDNLFITTDDGSCEMTGHLTTKSCCACPKIGYHLTGEITPAGQLSLNAKLRKGYETNSQLLETTGIENDFPPIQGVVGLQVTAFYLDGSSALVNWAEHDFGGVATNSLNNSFPIDCGTTSNPLMRAEVIFETNVTFKFASDCEYKIPAGTKLIIAGCGKTNQMVAPLVNAGGCRKPVFTWYKDDVVFRKVYANKVSTGFYQDTIDSSEGLSACDKYRLTTDCGCDLSTAYSCWNDETRPTDWVPCNPVDFNAVIVPNTCNREVNIDQITTCGEIFDGRQFRLYINGTLYATYTVAGGVITGPLNIVYANPITRIELRFPCDECNKCTIVKTFNVNNPCGCSGTPLSVYFDNTFSCEDGFAYTINGGEPKYTVTVVRVINGQEHEHEVHEHVGPAPITTTVNGPVDPGTYIVKVVDKYGCESRDTIVLDCCNLGNPSVNYNCDNQEIVISRSSTEPLEYNIGAGWFALNANNRISQALANGTYPGYVQLRKLLDHTCNDTFDLAVDCDDCDIRIQSASLVSSCGQINFTTNNPTDQYSINGTGSWVAGVSPVVLGTPLQPGQSVRLYVRNSAEPTCYDFVDLRCSDCPTYDIGTPVLTHSCITGKLTLSGLTAPPIPAFCPGGSVSIKYRINGAVWQTQTISTSFWAANIEFGNNITLAAGTNIIEVELELNCPQTGGTQRCFLGSYSTQVINNDTLLVVSYNCDDPNKGLRWTGMEMGPVQVNIAGIWTTVTQGYIITTNGTYLIRDLGVGEFCAAVKSFNVNCGGSGGGGGSTPCDQAANLLQAIDNCNGSVTVTNGYGAPINVTLAIKDNTGGSCTGSNIFASFKPSLAPGASHTFTGVPQSNGTKVALVSLPTGGDGCSSCKVIGQCSSSGCSLPFNPVLECIDVPGDAQNRIQIKVTNPNSVEVAVYQNNAYKTNLGAGASAILPGFWIQDLYTIKIVCISDVTVFKEKSQNFNC